jgi:hypothetical protein
MRKNPLKQLTDEELNDYDFCRKNNFSKTTVGNRVTEDYSIWLSTYNRLILYVISEQENIYESNNIKGDTTFGEVADILMNEELLTRKYKK